MESRIKKFLWFGASTLILMAVIYLADVSRFISAVSSARTVYLLPALLLGLMPLTVYAFTWFRFLNRVGLDISYPESLRLFTAGQFLNSITPIGQFGGEPFMAYIIKDNTSLKYEEAFSTVLSADIINSIPIITFVLGGAAYLFMFGGVRELVIELLVVTVMIVAVGGGLTYVLWFRSGTIENGILYLIEKVVDLTGKGRGFYSSVEERFEGVQEAFETIGESPWHLVSTALTAHFEFIFRVLCMYLVLLSFGVATDFTPIYFVLAFSSVAQFAPTPGGSGVAEASIAGFMSIFVGVPFATAIAAAIVFRLMVYWPALIVGYVSLLSLRRDI